MDLVAGFDAAFIQGKLERVAEIRRRLDRHAEAQLGEIRPLKEQIQALSDQAQRLSEELECARRRVADLEGSTSWRITAPLRALRRVLPGA